MHNAPKIARLTHDNFWTVAFSQPVVGKIMDQRHKGSWARSDCRLWGGAYGDNRAAG